MTQPLSEQSYKIGEMQETEKQLQDIRVSDYQLTCVGHARKQYIYTRLETRLGEKHTFHYNILNKSMRV